MRGRLQVLIGFSIAALSCANERTPASAPDEIAGKPKATPEKKKDKAAGIQILANVLGPKTVALDADGFSRTVIVSNDGKQLGKFIRDTFSIVDVETAEVVTRLDCCEGGTLEHAEFLPDGDAVLLHGRETAFWKLSDGKETRWDFDPVAIASANGQHWVGLSEAGSIHVVDRSGQTTKTLSRPLREHLHSMSLTDDGERLLIASYGALEVWDLAQERLVYDLAKDPSAPISKENDTIWVGFDDAKNIAAYTETEHHTRSVDGTWSAAKLSEHARLAPSTDTLACFDRGRLCIETSDRGTSVGRFGAPREVVTGMYGTASPSPAGTWLAVNDLESVSAWELETKTRHTPAFEHKIELMAAGGDTLVTGNGEALSVWNVGDTTPTSQLEVPDVEDVSELFLTSNGATGLALRKYDILKVDIDAKTVEVDDRTYFKSMNAALDNGLAVVELQSGKVSLYDVATSESLGWVGPYLQILDMAVSPADRALAIAADGRIFAWDNAQTEVLAMAQSDGLHGLVFSPDGKQLLLLFSSRVAVHSMSDGTEQRIFAEGLKVEHLRFLADGVHVVTGGADGAIRVFEYSTGQQRAETTQHTAPIGSLSTAGPARAVSLDDNGTLITWDLRPALATKP